MPATCAPTVSLSLGPLSPLTLSAFESHGILTMRALHLQIYYKLPNHDNIDKLNPALPSPKQKEGPRLEWEEKVKA